MLKSSPNHPPPHTHTQTHQVWGTIVFHDIGPWLVPKRLRTVFYVTGGNRVCMYNFICKMGTIIPDSEDRKDDMKSNA